MVPTAKLANATNRQGDVIGAEISGTARQRKPYWRAFLKDQRLSSENT